MALASEAVDLVIDKGAKFYKKFTWKYNDGNPVDLTGLKAKLQAKASDMSDVILLTLSTETITKDGDITLGGVNGTIELSMTGSATAALGWENAVYDLKIYSTADDADELIEGKITVETGITSV